MAHIDRIFSPGYLPDDQDILLSCLRTTGITKTPFDIREAKVNVMDVGGSRSERKKWFHTFDHAQSILFVASLSGYNECLVEDKTSVNIFRLLVALKSCNQYVCKYTNDQWFQNQMQEALNLFDSILGSSRLEKSAVTLLLTKVDLFENKLGEHPIGDYFPDYMGRSDDSAAGMEFFVKRFLSLNTREDREIEVFCTDVSDTKRFKPILQTVVNDAIERQRQSSVDSLPPTYDS